MRHLIALPRRGGKTHNIVEAVKSCNNGVLVVGTHNEASFIMKDYDLSSDQVIVARDIEKLRGRFPRPRLFVDNAELILEQLLGESIHTMSVTIGKIN